MKALLVAASAAAALVTAVPAAAEEPDDTFLETLEAMGMPASGRGEAIATARAACQALDADRGVLAAVDAVRSRLDLTEDEAAVFVGFSIGGYCPQHENLLR